MNYAARGGGPSHGISCGVFFITSHISNSRTSSDIVACLSFKLIEYFYCDYFYQNSSGTYYTIRGGLSNNSDGCGAFSVRHYATASGAYWYCGASLSFKNI